jgi:hypothetical protein
MISLFKRGHATTGGEPFNTVDLGDIREIEGSIARSPPGNMGKGQTTYQPSRRRTGNASHSYGYSRPFEDA